MADIITPPNLFYPHPYEWDVTTKTLMQINGDDAVITLVTADRSDTASSLRSVDIVIHGPDYDATDPDTATTTRVPLYRDYDGVDQLQSLIDALIRVRDEHDAHHAPHPTPRADKD